MRPYDRLPPIEGPLPESVRWYSQVQQKDALAEGLAWMDALAQAMPQSPGAVQEARRRLVRAMRLYEEVKGVLLEGETNAPRLLSPERIEKLRKIKEVWKS